MMTLMRKLLGQERTLSSTRWLMDAELQQADCSVWIHGGMTRAMPLTHAHSDTHPFSKMENNF